MPVVNSSQGVNCLRWRLSLDSTSIVELKSANIEILDNGPIEQMTL